MFISRIFKLLQLTSVALVIECQMKPKMSQVFIVDLFVKVQGSLSPSTPQEMFSLYSLQILSYSVETCQGQFNAVRYMSKSPISFTDNSLSVITYTRIQLITFSLKQPETRIMEICFLFEDVHSRQLEMIVFVRYAVYSEGVMLKQLRTNCRGYIYFSKS